MIFVIYRSANAEGSIALPLRDAAACGAKNRYRAGGDGFKSEGETLCFHLRGRALRDIQASSPMDHES